MTQARAPSRRGLIGALAIEVTMPRPIAGREAVEDLKHSASTSKMVAAAP